MYILATIDDCGQGDHKKNIVEMAMSQSTCTNVTMHMACNIAKTLTTHGM
jgi:hypothetical protein